MTGDDADSLMSYAGLGGAVACCAVLELLGGTAVLGGIAATFGLATSIAYLTVIGVAGLLTASLAHTYHSYQGMHACRSLLALAVTERHTTSSEFLSNRRNRPFAVLLPGMSQGDFQWF